MRAKRALLSRINFFGGRAFPTFFLLFCFAAAPDTRSQEHNAMPTASMSTPNLEAKRARLDTFLTTLSDTLHAELSVAFRDLASGQEYAFNAKSMMHAASTMKVPVMIEVFRQAEQGKLKLTDSILVKNTFASIVDGSPYSLDLADDSDEAIYKALGHKQTIQQLVEAMITVSSNLATNLLIEIVGAQNVMRTLHELGIQNMLVLRGVEDGKAFQAGMNNRTDAHSLMLVMAALATDRAASPASCRAMIDILKAQKFRENIPAGLPPEIIVANKTGSITAIDHDAAILYPPGRGPGVLVVLTRGITQHERAHAAIAHIAREIYNVFLK